MMVWCLGMYGSASTWAFNVVRELAACMAPERPVEARFVAESHDGPEPDDATTLVVKSHAPPSAALLAARAQAMVITIRDPRDAVASMMAHSKWPFDYALHGIVATAQLCALHVEDARACVLRFEDRFFDAPATLDAIAARLPGTLSAADRARVFAATRREAIDRFIEGLERLPTAQTQYDPMMRAQDTFDTVTRWHRHHAGRAAETGRWRRELAASQVEAIEAALLPWMDRFGYVSADEEAFMASLDALKEGWGLCPQTPAQGSHGG